MSLNLQALVDGMLLQLTKERAETQMTLGKLIDQLEGMPDGASVQALQSPRSYRGYYQDLAFEREAGEMPAAALLAICKKCMGEVFQGYKGGDFVMGRNTAIWIAAYGNCGEKIIELKDGVFVLQADK